MPPRLPEDLSKYTARAAAPDDASGAATCVTAAYEHYVARNGLVPVPMRQDYGEVIRDYQVTVVEHDGEIVAVLALEVADEGFLLDNIAVAPAHRARGWAGASSSTPRPRRAARASSPSTCTRRRS